MVASAHEEEEGGKSSDILEVMAWCKDVNEGMDWSLVLRLAKAECYDNDDRDSLLRVQCSAVAMPHIVEAARVIIDASSSQVFACANGLVFVVAVALAYRRDEFSAREVARAQALLWFALQDNFLLDASVWPVKTYDVLRLFDEFPAALDFPALALQDFRAAVTIVVPRCSTELMDVILRTFPGFNVFAGFENDERLPQGWSSFGHTRGQPVGVVLNEMVASIESSLALVVLGAALPRGPEDIERMTRVLASRRVAAVGGPLVDAERVYSDFCHRLRLRHYRVSFDSTYDHSIIFDAESAAAIRGSWFHEDDVMGERDGPCKLCDTLPPTFLARTDALYALRFHPMLDGEWALLDFALRASRTPLVEVYGSGHGDARPVSPTPGRRHGPVAFALCPFVSIREPEGLGGRHLYGRRDRPISGVSPAEPWFGDDSSSLGPGAGGVGSKMLRPSAQFRTFMEVNNLRQFTGLDGIMRHSGCNLAGVNCAVPNWVYRGWAVPTCCKETMRHLLFYIANVFQELGIRYIVTDGVLLGSYKFGGMLDWDADVDLHIHDDDFGRIEDEVVPRAAQDGHFVRKHANNRSFLLQANDHNYLLIELNKREEAWDPERVWQLPIEGRLFPAMENAHLNISAWYGLSFFQHRLRHVPEWEEGTRPMFCATPYHYNCVDETQVPGGGDCQRAGIC